MKKAKAYAAEFEADPSTETLRGIAKAFLKEIGELRDARRAETNAAMLAILDEQDRKWRAFARRAEDVKPNGFAELVKLAEPELHATWRHEPQRELSPAAKALIAFATLGQLYRKTER